MNNEEKIISMLETMYLEFSKRFENIESDLSGVKDRLTSVENSIVRIENDHGQKLDALFEVTK